MARRKYKMEGHPGAKYLDGVRPGWFPKKSTIALRKTQAEAAGYDPSEVDIISTAPYKFLGNRWKVIRENRRRNVYLYLDGFMKGARDDESWNIAVERWAATRGYLTIFDIFYEGE